MSAADRRVALRARVRRWYTARGAGPWLPRATPACASEFSYVGAYEVQADRVESQLGGFGPVHPSSMEAIANLTDPDVLPFGRHGSDRQQPLPSRSATVRVGARRFTPTSSRNDRRRMVTSPRDGSTRRYATTAREWPSFCNRVRRSSHRVERDRGTTRPALRSARAVIWTVATAPRQAHRICRESMVPTEAEIAAPGLWLRPPSIC